jgi:DNA-binding SARP family transcriptional activator
MAGAASSEVEGSLRIYLLGGLRIAARSGAIGEAGWRLRKARSLVELLALAPGHRLHRDLVTDLLWPDLDPPAARNNLKQALWVARRKLAAPPLGAARCLRLEDNLLALRPAQPLWVDVAAFEAAAAVARRTRDPAAYHTALALCSGDLLPHDRYEDWVAGRRETLHGLCIDLLVEVAGLHERRGEYPPAIAALEQAAAREPAHEEAHVSLMRLYALTGRRQRAAQQYARLRQALRRHLDAEPSATAQRLYEAIVARRFPPGPGR